MTTTTDNEFKIAAAAVADDRYDGDFARGFSHMAFTLAFPTFNFTEDQTDELTSVDRHGDLGSDAIYIAEEERQILLFQSKSSSSLTETELHDHISAFVAVPLKLESDAWVEKAHQDMKALANEYRMARRGSYDLVFAFATNSVISPAVRSNFADRADLLLFDPNDLEARFRKVMLSEYGPSTNVNFAVGPNQMHKPQSDDAVIYLTIPAHEYVAECKKYQMELFRYNPPLYLGANKVNQSIADTLKQDSLRHYFHLLNNGITAVCKGFHVADAGSGSFVIHVDDFQVVNGCQTTMTLFRNSAAFDGDEHCLIDLKIIQSEGLRTLISEATNTQTAIFAEDAFSNEGEQQKIRELLDLHSPPYFYAAKRGSWDQLGNPARRRFLDDKPAFGKHRRLTSKELAAVCLAAFGEPEAAKDKPRLVFEKVGGKNSAHYDRIFQARNVAAQWILPFELLRHANAVVKQEVAKDEGRASRTKASTTGSKGDNAGAGEIERGRAGEYGRYRMIHLAYRYLAGVYGEPESDFLSATASSALLQTIANWAPALMQAALDALVDSLMDARARNDISGLREFFRETRHRVAILDRFTLTLNQHERLATRDDKTLNEYLGIPEPPKKR